MLAGLAIFPVVNDWAIRGTVWSLSLSRFAGVDFRSEGARCRIAGENLQIVPDCTPIMPFIVFSAALVAFRAKPGQKVAGIVAGGAAFWVLNLVRIFLLVAVERWAPGFADFVHVYLFQTLTLVVACILLRTWIRAQPGVSVP
jgi:exosortase/archaeosortase family protein